MSFQMYNYMGKTYTLDISNWLMTVYDEDYHEEFGISSPQLIAKVLVLGDKVERK